MTPYNNNKTSAATHPPCVQEVTNLLTSIAFNQPDYMNKFDKIFSVRFRSEYIYDAFKAALSNLQNDLNSIMKMERERNFKMVTNILSAHLFDQGSMFSILPIELMEIISFYSNQMFIATKILNNTSIEDDLIQNLILQIQLIKLRPKLKENCTSVVEEAIKNFLSKHYI